MIIDLKEKTGGRVWVFESCLGIGSEELIDCRKDVEGICCHMVYATGLPTRCYPKVLETSTGHERGKIIV